MDILSMMISGGLSLKQGLGSQAETEARSWAWKRKILALDQWSATRALALQLCRKEFSQRWKVVKQVFIGRGKKYSTRGQTHWRTQRQRVTESHPCGNLNSFYGTFLLGFLWPSVLICLVHSSCLVYLRILPCVRMHLLARQFLLQRPVGRQVSFDITPLWPPRSLFVHVWSWRSLDLENE